MKLTVKNILSLLFALLAVVLTVLTLTVCTEAIGAKPVLVKTPAAAVETADAVMNAICAGDYETASGMMYGTPNLGIDRAPSDEVGVMLWDAFQDSLSYELVGECYTTDSGVAQDITFTCLDYSSVTASLRDRAQTLLMERVEAAENAEEHADTIYDENGDYREDFVMEVLRDVTLDALEEDAETMQQTVTVNLVCKKGQWWVVADQGLLAAISGGIAG